MNTTGVRWRYLRLLMEEVPEITRLDALGDQGWEVVGWKVAPGQIGVYEWLFKRMVLEHPAIVDTRINPTERPRLRYNEEVAPVPLQITQPKQKGQWSEEARQRARERGKVQAAARKAGQPAKDTESWNDCVKKEGEHDAEPAQQAAGE